MKKPVKKAKPRKAKPVKAWDLIDVSGCLSGNTYKTRRSAKSWAGPGERPVRVEIREI